MKRILLAFAVFAALGSNAQVLNNSFDNWTTKTAYFDGFNFFPADTFQYPTPIDWTTTNTISGADTFGGNFLIEETNDAHTGSSAVFIHTEQFDTVEAGPLGPRALTIPGIALNGDFTLDLASNVLLGGTISPGSVPDAGQPFTQRLQNFKGYFKYIPVLNTYTGHNDSCIVWATLRKGNTIVADAIFKSGDTVSTYTAFSVPFKYVSCEMPDTLVILIASSVPNFTSIISGNTNLTPGSQFWLDDLDYDVLPGNFDFTPIARPDLDSTFKNVPKTINVKANDDDCNDGTAGLTVNLTSGPLHGSGTIVAGQLAYVPALDYVGIDTFYYSLTDAANNTSDVVMSRIFVYNTTGINDINEVPVSVYPVPANNTLNVRFEYNGKVTARVFDMIGNLVSVNTLTSGNSVISTGELSNGVYSLQMLNEQGQTISRLKFTVSK